ncbi:MAG: restriction endonuclease subunit S, partial [Methylobacter sp.]
GKDTIDNDERGSYPFFVRSQTVERINSYSFDGEAILTAGDGVGVGKVFHYVNEKFDYHQRVYKISHFRRVVGKFIFYYMKENFHKDALRLNAKSTVDSLRMPMFQNFVIAFSSIDEQQRIVDYLDEKTAHIDRIVATINTQISKLKELRKTLINDVVTGKIKVVTEGQTA